MIVMIKEREGSWDVMKDLFSGYSMVHSKHLDQKTADAAARVLASTNQVSYIEPGKTYIGISCKCPVYKIYSIVEIFPGSGEVKKIGEDHHQYPSAFSFANQLSKEKQVPFEPLWMDIKRMWEILEDRNG